MTPTPNLALPILGEQTNRQLASAVINLVDAKRALDGNGWSALSGILGGSLPGRLGSEPAWPSEIMRAVLPFIDLTAAGAAVSALIPVAQTIGMNCKWSPRTVQAEKRDQLVEHLTDLRRASPEDFERSDTFWIRPFNLFLATEGKNRVSFLAACGVELMPSLVCAVNYPRAERLRLFEAADGCEDRIVCVLDNEHVLPVRSPSWSLPLMRAYGVDVERWPREFPSFEDVCAQLRAREADITSRLSPIRLTELRERLAQEASEPHLDALIGHESIHFSVRPLVPLLAAAILMLITAQAWPAAWNLGDLFFGLAFGAIGMVTACMTQPIVALRSEAHRALMRSRRPAPNSSDSSGSRRQRSLARRDRGPGSVIA
jgi:hypothetical protein